MFLSQGKKKALIIGNTYENTKFNPLPACRNDVDKFYDLVIDKLGFEKKDVVKKYNVFPKNVLATYIRTLKPNDLFLIFYAGHGGNLTLSPQASNDTGLLSSWINPDGTYFFSYELDKILSKISIKCKIILCSDSCYSGRFLDHYTGKNEIYFIGSSDVYKTSNYYHEGVKYGALVLMWEHLFYKYEINDIRIDNLLDISKDYRNSKYFLKQMTLKKINFFEPLFELPF